MDAGGHDGVAFIPLVVQGTSLGVLEISGPGEGIEEAWETLGVIANQAAVTLHNLSEQGRLRRQMEALQGVAMLGRDLIKVREPQRAVELVVGFIGDQLDLPVAAWIATANSGRMVLVSSAGPGVREPKELRSEFGVVSRSVLSRSVERRELVQRFAHSLAAQDIATVEAGDALLLVGRSPESMQPTLDAIGALLAGVLPQIASLSRAEQRNQGLDMGLAWTAHELRGPLLGVRAVLDSLLQRRGADPRELSVLRSSVRELDQLIGTAEALLAWAVGARPPRRRRTDVVRIVDEAARSCVLETGEERVVVLAPARAYARVDPAHLRAAVANLIRNALEYADPGTKVEVTIEADGDRLIISVKDEGPPIPPAERWTIFDPFVRGRTSCRARSGSGLGLFIARRVVEAHGGRIWVDPDHRGATFHIALPVLGGRNDHSHPDR
jgi:signal transduction histidine kinase